MIALLFALFTAAMMLSFLGRMRGAYGVFSVALLLSLYWLKFHATTPLTIQL